MSIETVLDPSIQKQLRANSLITESEVIIQSGDLFYAKDVLTNAKRTINNIDITSITQENRLNETNKTLLKG
jgi:hypothetical protein